MRVGYKAVPVSDYFDGKQFRESVDLPLTCHPSPRCTTFTIKLSEVRRLLLDLNLYGGTDALVMFSEAGHLGLSVKFR